MPKPFKFCPACASEVDVGDEEERICGSCGRNWYRNSSPSVGAAIVKDGRALVTVRGSDPYKGKFDVPGGFLQLGEDVIDALRRELREELDIEVDVAQSDFVHMVTHTYGEEDEWVLAIGFVARLTSGTPTPASDVADARWVSLEELDGLEFAWEHDRELARKALTMEVEG